MRWSLRSVLTRKRHSTHWIKQPVRHRYRPVNSEEPEPIVTRNWEKSLCIQASPFMKVKCEMTGTFQAISVLMTKLIMCITQTQEKVWNTLHLFETWGGKDKSSALLIAIKDLSPCVSVIPHCKKQIKSWVGLPKLKRENSRKMSWYILKSGTKTPPFYINNIWLLMVHLPTLCNGKTLSDLVSHWSHSVMCIPVQTSRETGSLGNYI